MKRSVRLRNLLVGLVAFSLLAAACSEQEGDGEEVREFIEATATEPHRFVYTETTPSGTETVVQGLIEDDFRRKARLSVDGDVVLEQVVSDDLAAVRFVQPDVLGKYLDKAVVSFVDTDTSLEGIDVFSALQSRRWVVDPGGAPPQIQAVDDRTDSGADPIFDSQQMLDLAVDISFIPGAFVKYSPNSISPTYRSDEDPFPVPEDGSDVDRYDVVQPRFPRNVDGAQLAVPGPEFFTKLSVYVRDGKVIRISQDVGLAPTVLDDFETFMIQLVTETSPPEIRDGFLAAVEELEGRELGQFLLDALNTFRDLEGNPPVRFRTATYELLDLGDDDIRVEVPTEETIEADLAVLLNLGVKPPVPEDDDGGPAGTDDET